MAHALRPEYIPLELRRIVLRQRAVLWYTPAQICVSTDLPLHTVQRICQRWDELCVVLREPHKEGPVRVMKDIHIKFVLAILARVPDLHIEELRDKLWYRHNVDVPLSTLDCNLKELQITVKPLSERAAEQTLDRRISYLIAAGAQDPERLVFVDGSAVNMLTTYRSRAGKVTDFASGDRYAIMPALALDGLLWIGSALGAFDGPLFVAFLDGFLERMNPWPEKHSVLVLGSQYMDVPGIRERCAARGVRLIALPPYAPELNPAEDMFAAFRAYIRQHSGRLREIVKTENSDHHRVVSLFLEALNEVARPDSVARWFRQYKRPN